MPDDLVLPAPNPGAIEVLRAAAEGARQESADLAAAAEAVTASVRIRHEQTGAERAVSRSALPFFTNQGYELVDDEPAPAPETPGRHEASEPADAADDPGASTTPIPPNKEN